MKMRKGSLSEQYRRGTASFLANERKLNEKLHGKIHDGIMKAKQQQIITPKQISKPKETAKPKEGNTKEKAKGFFSKIPKKINWCYATKDPKRNAEIRENIKKKEAAKHAAKK